MKNISKFLLGLLLCFAPSLAFAELHQVTSLTTSAAAVIIKPGAGATWIVIQNIGTNAVNVTLDGGSTYTDVTGKYHGQDPTTGATGLGYVIPAASSGNPGYMVITAIPGSSNLRWISAIMQTGTTVLNIITPASAGSNGSSVFPIN